MINHLAFLKHTDVPFDNNLAERSIRPAVFLCKESFGNRSGNGANTQAILMSVFFTLKKGGYNPVKTVVQALTTYLETEKMPALSPNIRAEG